MQDQYVTFSAAWFTLSLINAGLAQSKQRAGSSWWLVSLLLGPIATLLIVTWPPGGGVGEPVAGKMSRTQAVVIGVVVLLIALGLMVGINVRGGA